ncbi:MAG: hypothetical protein ACRCR9_02765 [Chitinophagaceae bacterium]
MIKKIDTAQDATLINELVEQVEKINAMIKALEDKGYEVSIRKMGKGDKMNLRITLYELFA